jgi:glycosyltransferase involved in cell wall biosynthesis
MGVVPGLVSVIIPTYNRASTCRRSVKSVLEQTYTNCEVLVIDDGSQDNTREIISCLDQRVKYYWQKNSGVSSARNKGLEMAQGEFIAFLDSDDTWMPWKLEAQLTVLKEFADAGMVWTDMTAVDEQGRLIADSYLQKMYTCYKYFNPEIHFEKNRPLGVVWRNCKLGWIERKCYAGNIFPWMFLGNLVHTSTVLLRQNRQHQVGFFDTELLKSGEDYDFHLRTCQFGSVAYLDVPSIHYRTGAADQLTSPQYMIWMARNDLRTISKILPAIYSETSLTKKTIRNRLAMSHAWLGDEAFWVDRTTARKHLWASLKLKPYCAKVLMLFGLSLLPEPVSQIIREMKGLFHKVLCLFSSE